MDPERKGPEWEKIDYILSSQINELEKSCVDCHTSRTPLWRSGPAGPRSLCNACGLRYRKRMRALLSLDQGRAKKNSNRNRTGRSSKLLRVLVKLGVVDLLGRKIVLHTSLGNQLKFKEEEQAALLLMALSCNAFYACK
ncbi:GATA transcription factor [Quillaja saponaria]|uniref:GATA transcription factor n=1 Tax=Quillaja saponaria TaxID=32244 RepID=A0AAD7VEL0_QUISA|nr:GATA transcription factor [Quillaja saponaria]